MPTHYTTILKAEDSERMAYPASIQAQFNPYYKYQYSKEYEDIIDYLTNRVLTLQQGKLVASQIKNVRYKA
ncbi:MAG: hypothetical protein M1840_004256 [Geoglossum simile]|nr:MAG: hypothetical protein M1840_004256 [Geoglossum simile]